MESSHLAALLERLKTDEDLRAKFFEYERSARSNALKKKKEIDDLADANLAAIKTLAAEAGFDISDSLKRPEELGLMPTAVEMEESSWACVFTCCFIATSAWQTETFGPRCVVEPPMPTI